MKPADKAGDSPIFEPEKSSMPTGLPRLNVQKVLTGAAVFLAAVALGYGWWGLTRFATTPGAQGSAPRELPVDFMDRLGAGGAVGGTAGGTVSGSPGEPGDLPVIRATRSGFDLRGGTAAPDGWRANGLRAGRSPLLLVFVHPGCSCTEATLARLDEILESNQKSGQKPVQVVLAVYGSRALDREARRKLFSFEPAANGEGREAQPLLSAHRVIRDRDGRIARSFGAATSGEVVLYSAEGRLLFQGGITAERGHAGASESGDALARALATGNVAKADGFSVFGCPIFNLAKASQEAGQEAGQQASQGTLQ